MTAQKGAAFLLKVGEDLAVSQLDVPIVALEAERLHVLAEHAGMIAGVRVMAVATVLAALFLRCGS